MKIGKSDNVQTIPFMDEKNLGNAAGCSVGYKSIVSIALAVRRVSFLIELKGCVWCLHAANFLGNDHPSCEPMTQLTSIQLDIPMKFFGYHLIDNIALNIGST
jgi:hypothetical protein